MSVSLHIRPFAPTDTDYAAVASICDTSALYLHDFEQRSGPKLRAFDEAFDTSAHLLRRLIAEDRQIGQVVGYAQLFPMIWLPEPGCFWTMVRVRPTDQRQGIGGRLYERALAELRDLGATRVYMQAHELQPKLCQLLERYGFHEQFRTWELQLDPRGFELAPFQAYLDRLALHGVSISTLAEQMSCDPHCLARVYELHAAISRDIPLPEQPNLQPPIGWFERYVSSGPAALPDGFFLASEGGRYVGESFVHRDETDGACLHHKVTGLLREARGRGIAMALKLKTILYAQEWGYTRITTWNESNNPEMLAINRRLGFVRGTGAVVFEREL